MYIFSIDVPPQTIYSYYTFASIMLMSLNVSYKYYWRIYMAVRTSGWVSVTSLIWEGRNLYVHTKFQRDISIHG